MAKRIKKLYNPTFYSLKEIGHIVPRDRANYIETSFVVGRDYVVSNEEGTETLNVTCTQNMPINLKVI